MNHVHQGLLGLLLASAGAAASAGLHHICYEDEYDVRNDRTRIVVGCADDGGRPCSVRVLAAPTALFGGVLTGGHPRIASPGTFYTYEISGQAARGFRFAVDFAGTKRPVVRECTVRTAWRPGRDGGAFGVLTGFSSDATGLVSTGVWRQVQDGREAMPIVPDDFLAVGGGFDAEPGAFAQRFGSNAHKGEWRDVLVRSFGEVFGSGDPANDFPWARQTMGYAIGLRIGELTRDDLITQTALNLDPPIVTAPASGTAALATTSTLRQRPPLPASDVIVGADFLALSSGISGSLAGHFATVSEPTEGLQRLMCMISQSPTCPVPVAESWRVQSRGLRGVLGKVSSQMLMVPAGTVIKVAGGRWQLRGKIVRARSSFDFAPGVDVAGLRGEYAVTAVGGATDSRAFNSNPALAESFLTRIEPRLDLGGARVEARHGINPVVAQVSAAAIGLKLVPENQPVEEVPNVKPYEELSLDWVCSLSDTLAKTEMCRQFGKTIPLERLCPTFGNDLRLVGLCQKP